MRWLLGTLIVLLVVLTLVAQGLKLIWPPDRTPLAIDAGGQAYAAAFMPKPKPVVVPMRPVALPPPRPPRLKRKLERFDRFTFDQRSIA